MGNNNKGIKKTKGHSLQDKPHGHRRVESEDAQVRRALASSRREYESQHGGHVASPVSSGSGGTAGMRAADKAQERLKKKKLPKDISQQRAEKSIQVIKSAQEGPTVQSYQCAICGLSFLSRTALGEHRVEDHRADAHQPVSKSPSSKSSSQTSKNSSPQVGQNYNAAGIAAQQRINAKKPKGSGIADRRERTRDLLFNDAGVGGISNSDVTKFACQVCNINFLSETTRQSHISEVHGSLYDGLMNQPVSPVSHVEQKSNQSPTSKSEPVSTSETGSAQLDPEPLIPTSPAVSSEQNAEIQALGIPTEVLIESSLQTLQMNNSPEICEKTVKTMRTVFKNLINASTVSEKEKFGRIRLSNPKINKTFVQVEGAVEVLLAIGFVEVEMNGESHIVFDFDSCLGNVHIANSLVDATFS